MGLSAALTLLSELEMGEEVMLMTVVLCRQWDDTAEAGRDQEVVIPQTLLLERAFRQCRNFQTIAGLFEAAAVAFPKGVSGWLPEINRPLVAGQSVYNDFTKEYALGAILGCFRIGVWLIDNWKVATAFDDIFFTQFPELIFSPRLAEFTLEKAEEEQFVGQLAEPVKRWVRGYGFVHQQCLHFARVHEMIQRIDAQVLQGRTLNSIGNIVLGKLCYAVLGTMGPCGQVHALGLFFNDLLPKVPDGSTP